MESKPVEIYSEVSNFAIVRLPRRQYPGSVVQGDSLAILLDSARTVWEKVMDSHDLDLVDSARELVESLQSRLDHYESVLREHGISLPYSK